MINQVPKDTVIEIANMVHFDVFGEDIQNIQGEMCRGLDERLKNRPAEYITVDTEYSVIEKPLIKQLSAQPIIEQVPSKPRIGLKQKITDKLKNLLGKV